MEKNAKATLSPVGDGGLKPVALVGFGDSRDGIFNLSKSIPVWTLNDAQAYDFPRIDRLFELHPLRDIVLEGERWDYLKKELPCPIYMQEEHSDFPSSARYPLEKVEKECFSNLLIGTRRATYLDSTFPYMLALAVIEGYSPIYCFGFEFGTATEYRYQRPGAALMMGWAAGRGAIVVLPEGNRLLPHTLYGYEDYQNVPRQFIVDLFNTLQVDRKSAQVELDNAQQDQDAAVEHFKTLSMVEGGMHVLKSLVDILDKKKAKRNGSDEQYSISRSNLEQFLHDLLVEESDWMGRLNTAHSRVIERMESGASDEKVVEAQAQRKQAFREMYMRAGAIRTIKHMIDYCDRRIADSLMMEDPYKVYEEKE